MHLRSIFTVLCRLSDLLDNGISARRISSAVTSSIYISPKGLIAPNLSSTASSISTVVVRFPPKPTIHIAFDQSYQHPIDKITMQTFGTAVIDHILHHIVHKVLVAYGFEKPFDCKTMPSHILSWQQSVLRSSLHHNTQLLNASIYYQTYTVNHKYQRIF